jgi:hypothetical protein
MLYRLFVGAGKGIVLPFLLLFLVLLDAGLDSLLGIKNSSGRSPMVARFLPGNAGLRLALVVLAALLAIGLGALAGSAIAGAKGAWIGGCVGYLLGSMSGGVFLELYRENQS